MKDSDAVHTHTIRDVSKGGSLMESEEILTALNKGGIGFFQWTTFFKLGFVYMRGVWPVFGIMFMGADPGYTCKLPDVNTTVTQYFNDDDCNFIVQQDGRNVTEKCEEFVYGDQFESTILTEFGLVCGNSYLVELSTTIYMIGNTLGAVLISPLSDRYGRKKVMLACVWIQGAFGVGVAFVQSYVAFVILRFIVGFLNMAIALATYVMVTELFDAKHRMSPSVGMNFFWSSGIMSMSLFGYLVRDWRHFELLISLPNFLTVLYIWFLPDSIPWLVLKGRWKALDKMLHSAARQNNVTLPPHLLRVGDGSGNRDRKQTDIDAEVNADSTHHHGNDTHDHGNKTHGNDTHVKVCTSSNDTTQQDSVPFSYQEYLSQHTGDVQKTVQTADIKDKPDDVTVLDLFKSPQIRRYTILMFYLWFVNSLSYFGILFSTPTLHGDLFVNLAISGAVEVPACILCIYVLKRTGRRKPLIFFMLLSGVMNIITIFIPTETATGVSLEWLIITLAMIGKFGITGSYSTVYLMSAEIFPTAVRNQAVGLSSFFENCGTIAAPFIVFWAKSMTSLPLVVFGSLTMLGGLLAIMLPETHNRALPENIHTLEDEVTSVSKGVTDSTEPIITRL